jgi:hydrogenase maturation protein HypF
VPQLSQPVHGTATQHTANGSSNALSNQAARRIVLAGGVQGLGVRPAIYRLAMQLAIRGIVQNTSRGVEIEIEGTTDELDRFERLLPGALPVAASIVGQECERAAPTDRQGFTIVKEAPTGALAARVPEDRGLCPECSREIAARDDRRHRYPFTSCTQCGPRYSVIRVMPFERFETTMAKFSLCPDCRREYESPGDRRLHAQTIACKTCGPKVWCKIAGHNTALCDEKALRAVIGHLTAGKIVALRGLGGYQLLVDATNESAVVRLRERKGRRAKPLAVMVESVEAARRLAHFDQEEVAAFNDPSAPIILVRANSNSGLAAAIHPHLDTVGLMRPTTPLHAILARDFGRPLVCTSANREGDPLEFCVEAA